MQSRRPSLGLGHDRLSEDQPLELGAKQVLSHQRQEGALGAEVVLDPTFEILGVEAAVLAAELRGAAQVVLDLAPRHDQAEILGRVRQDRRVHESAHRLGVDEGRGALAVELVAERVAEAVQLGFALAQVVGTRDRDVADLDHGLASRLVSAHGAAQSHEEDEDTADHDDEDAGEPALAPAKAVEHGSPSGYGRRASLRSGRRWGKPRANDWKRVHRMRSANPRILLSGKAAGRIPTIVPPAHKQLVKTGT